MTRQDQGCTAFEFEKSDYLIGILPTFHIWSQGKKPHFSITFRKRSKFLYLNIYSVLKHITAFSMRPGKGECVDASGCCS